MNKFSLYLTMILCLLCSENWAQTGVTPRTSTATVRYTYTMHCAAADGHVNNWYINIQDGVLQGSPTAHSTEGTLVEFESTGEDGQLRIKDYATGKYLEVDDNGASLVSSPTMYWTISVQNDGVRFIKNGVDNSFLNNRDGLKITNGSGGCSSWVLTEYEEGQPLSWSKPIVDGATYAIVNVQPSNSATRYYYLNNSNGTLAPVDATDKNTLSEWPTTAQFVAKDLGNGKFAFRNKSNGSYLAYRAFSATIEDWSSWTMNASSRSGFEDTYWFWCAKRANNSSLTGALIITNGGTFDNYQNYEYTGTAYSNNYGFVLLKAPDTEREAVVEEYNEWKATLYDGETLKIGAPASSQLEFMDLAIENEEEYDAEALRTFLSNVKTTNRLNLPTGYYYFRSIATGTNREQPYLYNNYFLSNNTKHHTLQSESKPETNTAIWYVENNGTSISIKNGDGQPLVQGNQSQGNNGTVSARETLTFGAFNASNFASFGNQGIYFTEALNAADNAAYYSVNNSKETLFVTTWASQTNARDNHWTFEPVENPRNIYNVVIEGAPESEAYVTKTDGQYAFNGGFLYGADIAENQLTAADIAGYNHSIDVKGKTITVQYFDGSKSVVTYVYKNGATEWLREKHLVENGADYPDLRTLPNGVKITTIPYGKVSANETIEIECTVDDKYDVPFSASYENAKWLYATIHSGNKYFWSYDSSTKRVKTNVTAFSSANNQDTYMWAIIGNPIAGYQIINKAAGEGMILTSASPKNDGDNGGKTFPVLSDKNAVPDGHNTRWNINAYDYGYVISREGESINLNRRGADLAYWTSTDQGSRIGFYPIEETINVQTPMEGGKTYQARNLMSGEIITDFTGMTISTGNVDGCYHLSSAASVTTTPAIFYASQSLSATADPVQWSSLSAFAEWYIEEKQDEPESIFNFGEPTYETSISTGKYYRLYCIGRDNKLMTDKYSSEKGVIGTTAFTDVESGSQIWKIVKTGDTNGAVGNFTLQNVLTGRYIGDQGSTSSIFPVTENSSSAKSFVTQTGTADGITYFTFSRALNGHGLHLDAGGNVVKWEMAAAANRWAIDEVELSQAQLDAYKAFHDEFKAKKDLAGNASTYNTTLQTFFSDNACTQLKSEYASKTDEQLRTAMSALPTELQEMAVCVKNDQWDENATKNRYVKDFRIHDYDIYSDPGVWADKTKVGGFSSLFHPTGITCKAGELLYILVGDDVKDSDAVLEIGIAEATHNGPSQRVEVHAGLNIIMPNVDGEAFVIYRLTNSEKYLKDYPTIKVHFANGEASGCFDMHRGHTNNDWAYLCSNMFTNKYLHIMGEHTVFSVESDRVRGAENIIGSLKIWDYIFMTEEKLIGHDGQWDGKYNPVIGARDQYSGNPNWSGTSANYSGIWKDGLLNYNSLLNGDRWVIYHEEAHGHQYPVNLAATTESSNNGFAQMVNHEFGLSSRRANGTKTLITFKNDGLTWVDILRGGEGANRGRKYYEESLWLQNHLFYQLYLYFHVAGNMPDFWPRLCDKMRANGGIVKSSKVDDPTLYSNDYLKFARACAEVSKTDLWEFFDAYGFFGFYEDVFVGNDLTAFNTKDVDATATRYVGDYGSYYMRMPSKSNEADKAYLAELKTFMQSQPNKAPNIMFIDDHIKDRVVADTAFAVTLDPSLAGQPVKFYDGYTGRQGDFGDMSDFNGQNEATNLDYSISGNTITVSGEGMVGVKIYDENGNLIRIYNTYTITLDPEKDADIATKLTNGTYTLVAALGNDTNLPLAKPSVTKYEMAVYNGNAADTQTYQVSGETVNANIPYSATTTGTDVPKLTGNAVALYRDVDSYFSLPSGLKGVNVFTNTKAGTAEAPEWNTMTMQFTDKADFYLPEDGTFTAGVVNYPRTNTAGLNSVCLPFAINKTDTGLPSGSKIYTLSNIGDTSISFSEVDEVAAGEFCIIDCPSDSKWGLGGTEITLVGTPIEDDAQGSFQNKTIGEGMYKLNNAGTKFGITTSAGTVTAFRGYLNLPASGGVRQFALSLEDAPIVTGVDEVQTLQPTYATDLQGRTTLTLQRGKTYIINGKKTLAR